MTAAQIDILLRDGDISERSGQKFCNKEEFAFTSADIKYRISVEMYQIFAKLFKFYSAVDHPEVGFESGEIYSQLKAQIEMRKNRLGARLKVLEDILEDEYKKLKKIIGQVSLYNRPETIKQEWFFWFFIDNGEAIVEYLKFDFLKGEKLASFSIDGDRAFLLQKSQFDKYYNTDDMQMIYDVISVEKSIKYIQGLIDDVKKPAHLLEHNAVRLLLLFKGKIITIRTIENIIDEYNLSNKANDILYIENGFDSLSDILPNEKTENKLNSLKRASRVKQLRSILKYLDVEQHSKANKYINDLNKLGKTQF